MPINYSDNPWFPDVLDQERLHLKKTDPVSYQNVWEGQCRAAVEGAVYHLEVQNAIQAGRIKDVPYNPMLKVHCVWDLGYNDQTSIIFVQRNGSEFAIIDYIEDSHRTLDEYAEEIKWRGARGNESGEKNPRTYNLGTMWLPHDGAAKNLQTGMSPADILRRQGLQVRVIQNAKIEVGIKAARQIFAQCYFDQVKTKRLLECLKRYRRRIPTTTGEPSSPIHDEFSHGADAFRYLGLTAQQLHNAGQNLKPIVYDNRGIV